MCVCDCGCGCVHVLSVGVCMDVCMDVCVCVWVHVGGWVVVRVCMHVCGGGGVGRWVGVYIYISPHHSIDCFPFLMKKVENDAIRSCNNFRFEDKMVMDPSEDHTVILKTQDPDGN